MVFFCRVSELKRNGEATAVNTQNYTRERRIKSRIRCNENLHFTLAILTLFVSAQTNLVGDDSVCMIVQSASTTAYLRSFFRSHSRPLPPVPPPRKRCEKLSSIGAVSGIPQACRHSDSVGSASRPRRSRRALLIFPSHAGSPRYPQNLTFLYVLFVTEGFKPASLKKYIKDVITRSF